MSFNKVEICGVNTAKLKILDDNEKRELLIKSHGGDSDARQRLICGNLKLVLSIIQRFTGRIDNLDDIFQVGCIGLVKAVDNFNIELEVKFSTYSSMCIRNEMLMYLRKINRQVNAEVSLHDTIGIDADGRELTYEDIIEDESQSVDYYLVEHIAKEFTESQNPLDRDILKALQEGHKQSKIGEMLGIKQPTVCRHIRKMKKQAKNLIF